VIARLLDRLGLGRRDLRAWALYDWANSTFWTTIVAAVFPIYYRTVAAAGQTDAEATSRYAWATALAILLIAVLAPILGAIADYRAVKKRLLGLFLAIGASATAGMYWITEGDWQLALVLFLLGNVGVSGSIVFYESLLPTSQTKRSSTGSPRPASRSDTSGAARCSPSTC
jgi:MFS transporter, UMF1 family